MAAFASPHSRRSAAKQQKFFCEQLFGLRKQPGKVAIGPWTEKIGISMETPCCFTWNNNDFQCDQIRTIRRVVFRNMKVQEKKRQSIE
jgi:hypothetical protein